MGERCTVEGTVQHVIFQNEENGYTVLGLLTEEGELVTVVGCIPCVAPGEKLTADGLWVSHPSYGWWSGSAARRWLLSRRSRSG